MHRHLIVFLTYVVFLTTLTSCGQEEKNQATQQSEEPKRLEQVQEEHLRRGNTPGLDTMRFETAFALFLKALQASDTMTINEFIQPDYGVWFIEQPGAMPRMTHVTDIRHFKRGYQDRSFFTVQEEVKSCDLQEEVWPTFDCADMNYDAGKTGYSKDGCFVWQPDKFRESGYWDYASLPEAEIRKIKVMLPLVQRSVLHTATSFEFHFGHVDGQWRLLFAKLIYPCSA
jgi:hypothetical protein